MEVTWFILLTFLRKGRGEREGRTSRISLKESRKRGRVGLLNLPLREALREEKVRKKRERGGKKSRGGFLYQFPLRGEGGRLDLSLSR